MLPTKMHSERSISFGEVAIVEFELGIGDNPSVSGGVPVALSQKKIAIYKMEVDKFEASRPQRRTKTQLVLDRKSRMLILINNGCQDKDIAEAVRSSRNIRHSRERSKSNKGWDPVHEVAEKALRKVIKPFRSAHSNITLEQAAVSTFQKQRM